jgi:phage shock protein A
MNCRKDGASEMVKRLRDYKKQLQEGICEMEATVDQLRKDIDELLIKRDALQKLNGILEEELKSFL